jgi:hypothetical protein
LARNAFTLLEKPHFRRPNHFVDSFNRTISCTTLHEKMDLSRTLRKLPPTNIPVSGL